MTYGQVLAWFIAATLWIIAFVVVVASAHPH